MNKVLVVLEKSVQNYSAYIPELEGCIATGQNTHETKDQIMEAVTFHLDGLREAGLGVPEIFQQDFEFEFKLDVNTLFEYFAGILTKVGLSRLTGMNQSLISQYANGMKKPSRKQIKKIQNAIHHFAEELLEVRL